MDNNIPLLQVTRTETEPCCVKLQIEVPVERVKTAFQNATIEMKDKAKMPGFRKGKAPLSMVAKLFSMEIESIARQRLITMAFEQVREEQNLALATDVILDSDHATLSPEQPFRFAFICELLPEITLPQYKEIPLLHEPVEVLDEEVDAYLESLREYKTQMEKTDGPMQAGDLLQVKFTATLPEDFEYEEKDSYLFKSDGNWMALRKPEFLPGIIDALTGIVKDQEIQADITFPEDYSHQNLAGKTVPYVFTMLEGMTRVLPELNDELAKQYQCDTLEELRDNIRQRLLKDKSIEQDMKLRQNALDFIMQQVNFEIPPALIKKQRTYYIKNFEQEARKQGQSKETIREALKNQKEAIDDKARNDAKTIFVLEKIAEVEELAVPENVIWSEVYKISQKKDEAIAKTFKRMQKDGSLNKMVLDLLHAYTVSKLIEWAKISEKNETPKQENNDQTEIDPPEKQNVNADQEITPDATAAAPEVAAAPDVSAGNDTSGLVSDDASHP